MRSLLNNKWELAGIGSYGITGDLTAERAQNHLEYLRLHELYRESIILGMNKKGGFYLINEDIIDSIIMADENYERDIAQGRGN